MCVLTTFRRKSLGPTARPIAIFDWYLTVVVTVAIYRKKMFVEPIIKVVEMLPKDELAAMAKSFVRLTSFKRRVSMDAETVAEPIDVAVISKGDGLIWVRRKHYFEPGLNRHFFRNYFKDDPK